MQPLTSAEPNRVVDATAEPPAAYTFLRSIALFLVLGTIGASLASIILLGRATHSDAYRTCCRVPEHICDAWNLPRTDGYDHADGNVCGACQGLTCEVTQSAGMCSGKHPAFGVCAFLFSIVAVFALAVFGIFATRQGPYYPRAIVAALVLGGVLSTIAVGIVGAAEGGRIRYSNHSKVATPDDSPISQALPYMNCSVVNATTSATAASEPSWPQRVRAEQYAAFDSQNGVVAAGVACGCCLLGLAFVIAALMMELRAKGWGFQPAARRTAPRSMITSPSFVSTRDADAPAPIELPAELLADDAEVPAEFICPLTQTIMDDPVCTADGQTYQRTAIEEWFRQGQNRSPATNLPLPHLLLTPNLALRDRIVAYGSDAVAADQAPADPHIPAPQ